MIITKEIEFTMCAKIKEHYHSLGYIYENGEKFVVPVETLKDNSCKRIDVKCDYCGRIIKVVYNDYNDYKFDKYSCKYCRQIKTSEYSLKSRQQSLYKRALSFCNKKGYKLISDISSVKNSDSRVFYECPKHGIHEVKIYSLIIGMQILQNITVFFFEYISVNTVICTIALIILLILCDLINEEQGEHFYPFVEQLAFSLNVSQNSLSYLYAPEVFL